MIKKTIVGIEMTITNPLERLSMGGPFTGDVSIGNEVLLKNCVLDNFVRKKEMNLLFFVKYHEINLYRYFSINFCNTDTRTVYEFNREFDMVYIKEFISKNELLIYLSFNDKTRAPIIFNLDEEEFSQV